jgi:hypothetical protein
MFRTAVNHHDLMTRIGKNRRKVSANSSEVFSQTNCAGASFGIPLEFSPVDQGQIRDSHAS